MSIIYCLVAREKTVLVEYSDHQGNFEDIAKSILKLVKPNTRSIYKYNDNHHFNVIKDEKISYLCLRETEYPKDKAFEFLENVKTEFLNTFTNEKIENAFGFGFNVEFKKKIFEKMNLFNGSGKLEDLDPISKLKEGLIDSKNSVIEACEELSMRGDKVALIVSKADSLRENSGVFLSNALKVKRVAKMRNIKIIIACVLLALVISYILVTVICGGFAWADCL